MGDDNEDMEGFQIWKTGYWQQFLRGQPYHIRQILIFFFLGGGRGGTDWPPSALYVVDLVWSRLPGCVYPLLLVFAL